VSIGHNNRRDGLSAAEWAAAGRASPFAGELLSAL
jgi:hypothetical protein